MKMYIKMDVVMLVMMMDMDIKVKIELKIIFLHSLGWASKLQVRRPPNQLSFSVNTLLSPAQLIFRLLINACYTLTLSRVCLKTQETLNPVEVASR